MKKRLTTFEDFLTDHAFGGAAERPFNGQAHTFAGERGRRPLPPLRYRDLADAVVRGWAEQMSVRTNAGSMVPECVDPDALAQSVLRWVEERERTARA